MTAERVEELTKLIKKCDDSIARWLLYSPVSDDFGGYSEYSHEEEVGDEIAYIEELRSKYIAEYNKITKGGTA